MQKRMEWTTLRFDWNRARAFFVTAEEGSFSAAARALHLSQPTVGRQVAALEEELDVTLFERVGRQLVLTDTGLELVEHVRAMGEMASRLSRTAAGRSLSLDGPITITASEIISARLLPPILLQIRTTHPGILIEVVADNAVRDLSRREADIAVRNAPPSEPDLVARKLHDAFAWAYASPAYLAKVGPIDTLADFTKTSILGFPERSRMLNGLNALGMNLSEANFPVVTASHLVQWEMCKAGLGISLMMAEVGDREPRVRKVLPSMAPLKVPMWLVSHREVRTSRRVRVVFDLLAKGLAKAKCEAEEAGG